MRKKLITFIFSVLITGPCFSKELNNGGGDTAGFRYEFRNYPRTLINDARGLLTAPAGWKRRQYLQLSTAGSILAASWLADEQINRHFLEFRTPLLDKTDQYFFDPVFQTRFSIPLMAAYFLTGLALKNERIRYNAVTGTRAVLFSAAATAGLKMLFQRHRPEQSSHPRALTGPATGFTYASFPSGHATTAFVIATVVSEEFREKPAVGIVMYSLAGLVALSRIYNNSHWASDVAAGAIIGWSVSKTIVRLEKKK